MSSHTFLPRWFHLPRRMDLATGHHLRPVRPSDQQLTPVDANGVRYVLLDDEERTVLGWVDLAPSSHQGHDADVSWQVVGRLSGSPLEEALAAAVPAWVTYDWPFTRPRLTPEGPPAAPCPEGDERSSGR